MAQNPLLTQLQCATSGATFTVRVSWQYIQGQTYFVAVVFDPSNTIVAKQTVDGSRGTTVASLTGVTLAANTNYTVCVAQSDASGNLTSSYSQPLNLLQAPLTNIQTTNDLTSVTIGATPPTVGSPSGISVNLLDSTDTLVTSASIAATGGVIDLPQPLNPAQTYHAYLAPSSNQGLSTGSNQRVDLQMIQPAISAISYDGNNLTVTTATTLPSGSTVSGTLSADRSLIQQKAGSAVSVSFQLAMATLDMSKQYGCVLRALTGGNAGPASAAVKAVVAPPRLESAYYAGGHVGARWTVPPIEPVPAGALLAAIADGSVAGTPETTLGYLGDVDISKVTVAASLKVQVNSVFGVAKGPPASIDLPFSKPSITSVSTTSQGINVAWSDSGTAPGYRLYLNDSKGKAIAFIRTTDLAGALALPVNPAAVYTTSVQPFGLVGAGIEVQGPISDTVPVLAAAPAVTTISYDGAKVTVNWTAPKQTAGITGYEAVFTAPGTQETVALGASSPKQITIPTDLGALTPIEVAVRAKGTTVTGPLSGSSPVLRDAPTISEASVVDGSLALAWAPAIGALEGYAVTLDVGGTKTTSFYADTAAILSLGTVSPSVAYTVAVEARSGVASGGAMTLPLVVTAPALGARSFDGDNLSIAVTAPASPSPAPTGYRVELVRNGEVIRRADLAAPQGPLVFALSSPSDAAAPHTVRVRARAGAALGPAAEAPVVLATPTVARIEVDAKIVGIVAMQTIAGQALTLQAALVVDGTVGTAQATDATGQVSFDLPGSGKTWAIVARAAGGGDITGPWSAPLVIPVAAPTVSSAAYDGAALHVAWSGDAGSEYLVMVVSAGQEIARARATGLAARLPFAVAISAPADVVVRQVSGVALGPSQSTPLVLAGCAATAVTAAAQDSVTVTWATPANTPKPTAVVPVLQWEGSAQDLADQPVATNSFAVSLAGVPAGAAIGVRARAGAALGPVGNLVPVVLGHPTNIAVTWDAETVSVEWSTPKDPRIDGALVTLTPGQGQSVVNRATGTRWSAALTAEAGAGGSVSVAAAAGTGTGAASDPAAIIVAPPALTRLGWDGATLTASWTAPALPKTVDGYVLEVSDADGLVIVRAEVDGTSAALAVPPSAAEARTLTIAARAQGSLGPPLKPFAVPTAGPALLSVIQDPLSGAATASWAAVGGTTTGYLLQLYRDGRPSSTPIAAAAAATSIALPSNPGAFEELEVALAVQGTDKSVATTGPAGPRLRVPTQPVVIGDVDFDGAAVRVTWRPVSHASGYALAVVAQGLSSPAGHDVAGAGETARRFAVTLGDPTLPYEVVVQPTYGASIGIAARAPLFTPGLYVRPAAALPDVLPKTRIVRASSLALTPDAITAYLPELGKLDPQTGLAIGLTGLPIAPPQGGTNDIPFTLAAAPSSAAPLKYILTIANGALRFDAGRATLADAYRQLLKTAETNGATPRGVLVIQQTICRLMPQTFDETLYYAYGLSATNGCIDLRPGMVLRVGFSGFDLTAVSNAPVWSTGYVGGAVVDYDVGDLVAPNNGGWLVGFDAFVNWLVSHQALIVPSPQRNGSSPGTDIAETGGADAADLSFPAFTQPFYRLLAPGTLQTATSPAVSRTGQQFTIAAAPSWTLIDAATPAPGGGVDVAYFRGRAVVRACIRVQVEAAEYTVPIGTTVGNLLDRLARRPPSAAVALRGLRLERAPGPAILDPANGFRADAMTRVHLDWNGIVSGTSDAADALSLPLLHGDRISFGELP
jgi:hypothetical protein